MVSQDTSPYTENTSPNSFNKPSPRDFWSTRELLSPSRFDSENTPERSPSPNASPHRRPSVERLQKAGRVKTSNIFALETKDAYDPSSLPIVERPSANRPLSEYLVNNSFARADSMRKENSNPFRSPGKSGHRRTDSEISLPMLSPSKQAAAVPLPTSPEKPTSTSPTKSSLSRISQFGSNVFDELDAEDRVETPRALHRHAKSVTFHEDPPTINEYEHPTPEPSVSVASDREGSWDSEDYDDPDYSFERYSSAEPDRDDSFDADLENADKTPVVLPEDWSRMSPDEARTDLVDGEDDVFDGKERPALGSRIASDSSESRPLPPIPGFTRQERRDSGGLSSAAERAAQATRNAHSPPKRASCSKDDILKMGRDSSMSLQERLGLMAVGQDADRPNSKSSQETVHEEITITNLDTGERRDFNVTVSEQELEGEDSLADMSAFVDAPPRISRESILRKVRGTKYDFDDEDDDVEESQFMGDETTGRPTIEELARMNPDQPIPSREHSRETSEPDLASDFEQQDEVVIKPEPVDEEQIDLHSIPAAPERSPSRMDDHETSVLQHGMPRSYSDSIADDDTASRYSSEAPDAESTMLHHTQTTLPTEVSAVDDGKETLDDAMALLTVKDYAEAAEPPKAKQGSGEFMGLPAYLASEDFDFGMKEYITPPGSSASNIESKQLFDADKMPNLQPPADLQPPQAPYTETDVSPPGTPDSVIHKPDDDDVPVSPIDGPSTAYPTHVHIEEHVEEQKDSPEIPERKSTIRTSGKLKTRKSGTQADLETMAEQRRMVSIEMREHPVPDMPQQYQASAGADEAERPGSGTSESQVDSLMDGEKVEKTPNRRKSRKSGGRMDLMLDTSTFSIGDSDGLGLDTEFDKVIEAQKVCHSSTFVPPFQRLDATAQHQQGGAFNSSSDRDAHSSERTLVTPYSPHIDYSSRAGTNRYSWGQKGYLMRQNTKLVVASNRNVSGSSNGTAISNNTADSNETPLSPTADATPRPASSGARPKSKGSPRKGSAEQFLKTEPWNGKQRRKSLRNASAAKTAYRSEPAPPMPGQESALGVVDEDFAAGTGSLEEEVGDDVERGRLFVKVVGVKDLDLPLPRNDRVYFQLTLDNGLHCVTTTQLELGKSAPIGQEFELVVLNDLEFQLTLNTNLPPPPKEHIQLTPSSPTKSPSKTGGAFARFLTSPKKRAEKERQEREAAEAEERRLKAEAARKRASQLPTAWDLLHDLVNGSDGSFARAYVNLKSHEQHCFGRQLTVDVPCYNEWAAERDNHVINSVRSKRGAQSGPVRRPPYVIGQLELQLLYVPKPRGGSDDDMPKSMSSAIREMNRTSAVKETTHEGCLSQQGGDCTHWRRRFFRLQNSRLTAYHEHTHQKRAVINLSKASRLVDDKTTLVADLPSSPSKSGKGRRKSGFAEEDEGYQYVEEGFRIRFANGETIDFYADSRAQKDEWMAVLSQVIGKPDVAAKKEMKWTDLVLARERAQGAPLNGQGVDVKDFSPSKASSQHSQQNPTTSPPKRELSHRKPVASSASTASTGSSYSARSAASGSPTKSSLPAPATKSAPTSPWKPGHGFRKSMPVNEMKGQERPKTPPMNPRRGHRSRDAVKSMIF